MSRTSPSKLLDQFVLRLPDGLRDRLSLVASANGRSMNSEIVERLEDSLVWRGVHRLRLALASTNETRMRDPIEPSQIAEAIGEESAGRIENVFAGVVEPSFELLDRIAGYLRVAPTWLKHGRGCPYAVKELNFYGIEMVDKLLTADVIAITLIRSTHPSGLVAIVVKTGERDFATYKTRLHLSLEVGAGGQRDLAHFSNACRAFWTRDQTKVNGKVLAAEEFELLIAGETFPANAVAKAKQSRWFDDWWDETMFEKANDEWYWPDFQAVCRSTLFVVESDERLKAERKASLTLDWGRH